MTRREARARDRLLARERMRERHRWAKVLHAWLIYLLGGCCDRCGDDGSESPLTVDHVGGCRTWDIRSPSFASRVARYWAEACSGVPLRVLCVICNTDDRNERHAIAELPEAPF